MPSSERSSALVVRVVVIPPLVRRSLRIALRRVLPPLLAAERGDVEIAPGGAKLLIAAGVDEVGPEDPITLPDEGIVPMPLVHPEILVEVVGEGVPGNELPAHPLLQAPDLRLRSARDIDQRRIPRVEVGRVSDLIGAEGAADAGPLGVGAA